MNTAQKERQLRKYKFFATGLFVLMAVIFVLTTVLQKDSDAIWLGFVRAFAEAAMVGALADWFAVTALFHHPLGIKIPHTNLIEKSKERIGDNLGEFVVSNFLSPENIRPYILKLQISSFVGEWLSKEKNQETLLNELSMVVRDIISKLNDDEVVNFIENKAREMTSELRINTMVGNGLSYILDRNDHQKMITSLAKEIKFYVAENRQIIQKRVKKDSYFLIPKFVDNTIAEKITDGLVNFFEEVENDYQHSLRQEITNKLYTFSNDIISDEEWYYEFKSIQRDFIESGKLRSYSEGIWVSIKKTLSSELDHDHSAMKNYVRKNLKSLAENLVSDADLKNKVDRWVRFTAYKYLLRNTHQVHGLISSTVGKWEGRELSEKLELEVGKDLQFIRVNGTLVGGLVGLIIYTIAFLIG